MHQSPSLIEFFSTLRIVAGLNCNVAFSSIRWIIFAVRVDAACGLTDVCRTVLQRQVYGSEERVWLSSPQR